MRLEFAIRVDSYQRIPVPFLVIPYNGCYQDHRHKLSGWATGKQKLEQFARQTRVGSFNLDLLDDAPSIQDK
jgi:hypothetical protein